MNVRQKIRSFFFPDLLRGLRVSLRYVLGGGAARKKSFSGVGRTVQRLPSYDSVKCTGCRLCVKICPTQAVVVQTKLHLQELPAVDFRLNPDRCVSCGLCAEACPEDALRFEGTKKYVRR